MHSGLKKLSNISEKQERLIIGLMSGTSLDGLDIALCKVKSSGINTKIELLAFETIPYISEFKSRVKNICFVKQVDLEQICLLNKQIGVLHADYIIQFLKKYNFQNQEIDLIASHGQTIYHSPQRLRTNDDYGNSTLQIGDADQIAVKTGVITVSDFRQKNIAQGEEGAPLALYGDYLLFKNDTEDRVLLNIGGISNFTILKANSKFDEVLSSDLGPGNTLMDQYIQSKFPNKYFDENAEIAMKGKINEELLNSLLNHPFFEQNFPKTTGPELFNLNYLTKVISTLNHQDINDEDILATLNQFTAKSIAIAINKYFTDLDKPVIYLSGGGAHNPLLKINIQKLLPNATLKSTDDLGINPDAKEAILFALLANETVAGDYSVFSTNTLSMGKISFPF